jgi:hypothetical protein
VNEPDPPVAPNETEYAVPTVAFGSGAGGCDATAMTGQVAKFAATVTGAWMTETAESPTRCPLVSL